MTEHSGAAQTGGTLRNSFNYADSEREARSNLLIQHLQLGEQVVILEGDPGAGRTHLLRRLLSRDDHGLHIHAIQAEPGLTLTEILVGLLENLQLPAAPSETPGRVRQHAIERVVALTRGGAMPVLAIDDADTVESELLADLLSFREETSTEEGHPLGLLLVGSVRLNLRIADAGHNAVRVPLHGFHLAGTRAFLDQALRAEGHDVERLLDDLDVEAIHEASGGRPGGILQQARRQLAGPGAAATRRGDRPTGLLRRARSPTTLVVIGAGLAALVAALVWFQQGPPDDPSAGETLAETQVTPAEDADDQDAEQTDAPESDSANDDSDDALTPSSEPPLTQQTNSVRVDDETDGDNEFARLGADAALDLDEGDDDSRDDASREDTTDTAEADPAADEDSDNAPAESDNDNAPAPDGADQEPGSDDDNATSEPASEPPPDGDDQSPLAETLNAGEAWAADQSADRWTIQLVGAYSGGTILDWMAEHAEAANLHLLRTNRDGRDWYVVVTGAESSREAAQQRRDDLPEALRDANPWVRRLGGLTE